MDVSENRGTPKSSILIGCSIIFTIHFGVPLFFGNTQNDQTIQNTDNHFESLWYITIHDDMNLLLMNGHTIKKHLVCSISLLCLR